MLQLDHEYTLFIPDTRWITVYREQQWAVDLYISAGHSKGTYYCYVTLTIFDS